MPCALRAAASSLWLAGSGTLAAPSELYDPAHPLLSRIFAGQAQLFPAAAFATPTWLSRLRQAGLKRSLDAAAVLTAARGIAERARRVAAAATAAATGSEGEGAAEAVPVPAGALLLAAGPGQRLAGEAEEVWGAACGLAGCLAEGSEESASLVGGGAGRAFLEELRQVGARGAALAAFPPTFCCARDSRQLASGGGKL